MPYIGKPQSSDPITVNASNIEDGSIIAADISSSLGVAISGSFTTVSSSLGSRITLVEGGTTSKTLVSSSVQIASDISGSLGSNAAIIRSLDRTTISGSIPQALSTTSSPTFNNITATGTLTAQEIHTEFTSASILFTSGSTQFGNSSDDVHDFLGNTISGSATSTGSFGMVGVGGLPGEGGSKLGVDGNIEILGGGNRLFIPRASDGALTTSIFSRTGNNLTLSGAGSSGGQVEFIPSSANSSAVTLTIESSGRIVASSVLSAGQDYLDGDASLYLANAGSDGTMIKFGDTNAGLVYGGSGTGTFKLMQRQNNVFSIDASRNTTFAGGLTVDKDISAGDLNTAPIVTFKNSQGSGHYTAIKFEGADGSGANTGFIGYMSHNTITTRRFVISHDGVNRDFAINSGSLATFIGNINQEKAGNLRHTILATGNGEASLHLHANNSTGDSFIRFQTDSTTFAMGFDNSDSDKWILSVGSDPHSDSIINIQPDGSLVTFDKAVSFNSTVAIGANPAKLSVGAAAFSSAGSAYDFVQVGHSAGFFCETADAADRNAFIGNNMYHNGSNWRTVYEDQVSAIQFRAGTIRFNTAGATATDQNLTTGGGEERLRIKDSGQIETTYADNSYNLYINGLASSSTKGILMAVGGSSGTVDQMLFRDGNSHNCGTITSDASANTTAYGTSSDYRLKENEVIISDGIERLKKLKPYRFNFISAPDQTQDGFFAHELAEHIPEAVTGEKDAMEDGEIKPQNVDYGKITPLLVGALKEAITKIETLEAQMAQVSGSS